MQVFKHDQQRLGGGNSFEEATRREEKVSPLQRLLARAQSHKNREMEGRLFGLCARNQFPDRGGQLAAGRFLRIGLVNSRRRADQLHEGSISRAIAIRQAPTPSNGGASPVDECGEFALQPRLSDAWGANDRDQVRAPVGDGSIPDGAQEADLPLASHHWRPRTLWSGRQWTDCTPGLDRLWYALRSDRVELLVANRAASQQIGLMTDHQRTRERG